MRSGENFYKYARGRLRRIVRDRGFVEGDNFQYEWERVGNGDRWWTRRCLRLVVFERTGENSRTIVDVLEIQDEEDVPPEFIREWALAAGKSPDEAAELLPPGADDPDYSWTVEIRVHPRWVADGFNLTAERLDDILVRTLSFATGAEFSARVISAPDPKQIRAEQGYREEGYKPKLCDACYAAPCVCPGDPDEAECCPECGNDDPGNPREGCETCPSWAESMRDPCEACRGTGPDAYPCPVDVGGTCPLDKEENHG